MKPHEHGVVIALFVSYDVCTIVFYIFASIHMFCQNISIAKHLFLNLGLNVNCKAEANFKLK